jgi:hypothetical protein
LARSTINKREILKKHKDFWIISEGRDSAIAGNVIEDEGVSGPVKEYYLSGIGRYLLNPKTIEVRKKLIGCEIHYKQRGLKKIHHFFRRFLPMGSKRKQKMAYSPEVILSRYKLRIPHLQDPGLEDHLTTIYKRLRFYDSVSKRLAKLNPRTITQIVGICEDIGGNFSYLKLQGSIEEKIKYIDSVISKDVRVLLNRACVAEGLFELRGYDFESHSADKFYQILSYNSNGQQKACVLTDTHSIDFYLNDTQLLRYMHLLELSLKANPGLRNTFDLSIQGKIKPLKLFFNKKLEIDYAKAHFPEVYKIIFNELKLGPNQQNLIKPILNYLQIGVSLNFLPRADTEEGRMHTHTSVLHDIRAVEPLRKNLAKVYAEIQKRTFDSDAGVYYLLDSFDGFSNAK